MVKVLRRVLGGRIERTHCAVELGTVAAGGRIHRESDSAAHPQISHNK